MLTDAATTARLALVALLAVLTDAGATTGLALVALPAMLTDAGTTACRALGAPLAVFADVDAAACLAPVGMLAMWALLNDAPLDWMRRWGFRRCCRSCCGCRFHCVAAASCSELWLVAF